LSSLYQLTFLTLLCSDAKIVGDANKMSSKLTEERRGGEGRSEEEEERTGAKKRRC
jgi:hypothetical protein